MKVEWKSKRWKKGVDRHISKMEALVQIRKQETESGKRSGQGSYHKGLGILVLESQLFPKNNRNPSQDFPQKMT